MNLLIFIIYRSWLRRLFWRLPVILLYYLVSVFGVRLELHSFNATPDEKPAPTSPGIALVPPSLDKHGNDGVFTQGLASLKSVKSLN